jgi:hypothetical protein
VSVAGVELTGGHRRRVAVPIFEDLKQVATFGIPERLDQEAIKDQHVQLGEAHEQPRLGPVGAGDCELLQETKHACVQRRQARWPSAGAR